MAFQSNEGKTSGVCRDCNELPNTYGVCGCAKTQKEHPNHETTSDNYCISCVVDKKIVDDHIKGAHRDRPQFSCPHCEEKYKNDLRR